MRVRYPVLAFAAAAAVVPLMASAAPAMPLRKAGWWEMTMQMSAPAPMTQKTQLCTDAATEAKYGALANQGPQAPGTDCTQGPVIPTPGGWRFSSTCKMRGMTTTTSGVATGDFKSNYRVETTTTMSPAPMPSMAQTKMVITSRYLGACPAGRKPGDVVMGNGMVMNMNRGR